VQGRQCLTRRTGRAMPPPRWDPLHAV